MLFCPKCIFARFVNCGIFKLCNCVFVWFVGFDHSELCFCKNYSIVFLLPCLFSEICWCYHVQNKIAIFVIVITQRLYHTKCIYELSLLVFLKVFFSFSSFSSVKTKNMLVWLVHGALRHFQQYFSYIVAVTLIGGGNQRKPPTCRKSLTNFIAECCIAWVGFELTTLVVIGTGCIDSCKSNYNTITTTSVPKS